MRGEHRHFQDTSTPHTTPIPKTFAPSSLDPTVAPLLISDPGSA